MSVSSIISSLGTLNMGVMPDLTTVGYTRESPPTPHVVETRQRLSQVESRAATLETKVQTLEIEGVGGGVSQIDFNALLGTVNELSQTVAQLGNGTSANNGGGGSGVSQADFMNLLMTVNDMSQIIDVLRARLAYAEGYLKMIDEAIAVEDFPGWSPPFSE